MERNGESVAAVRIIAWVWYTCWQAPEARALRLPRSERINVCNRSDVAARLPSELT
jgi:hypothetical protein